MGRERPGAGAPENSFLPFSYLFFFPTSESKQVALKKAYLRAHDRRLWRCFCRSELRVGKRAVRQEGREQTPQEGDVNSQKKKESVAMESPKTNNSENSKVNAQ